MTSKSIDSRPGGTGDLAVALWIAEGARAVGETVTFVEEGRADIVRAFGHQSASEPTEDCMPLGTDSPVYQEELRTSDQNRSARTERWQRTMGWHFPSKRPSFRILSEEATGWANAMVDGRPTVVIAPRAVFSTRTLPQQKWIRMAWALHAEGIRTVAIDGAQSAVDAFPFYAYGFGWTHTLALLSRAAVVVGNDSGIAHLAATIGVPTVAAMGPTDPEIVFGHCHDVLTPIVASSVECAGCHFAGHRGFQGACDHGCEALQAIPWRSLYDAVHQALDRKMVLVS